jgi:hypothetical protein
MTQKEDVRRLPRTTTLDYWDYWRNMLKANGMGIVEGIILGLVIERTYMQILATLLHASISNWWLIPSIIVIIGLGIIINRPRRRKEVKASQER